LVHASLNSDETIRQSRKEACDSCSLFRHGWVHAETWCSRVDDQPRAKNCEGSKHRRWRERLAATRATCPLGRWSEPGAIHLPSTRTIVYTLPDAKGRHERVRHILDAEGFSDWEFFYGKRSNPYWVQIPHDHAKLLRENEPPLLILEDDIEPRLFRPWVMPPAGAELVYLGAGKSRRGTGIRNAKRALPGHKISQAHQYGYENIDATWMRVFGMLYTHAILYVDRRVMREVAEAISSTGWQIDVTLARMQWRWFCACLKIPAFWQNDGRHRDETFEYAPGEIAEPVEESRREQVWRLRQAKVDRALAAAGIGGVGGDGIAVAERPRIVVGPDLVWRRG